MLRARIDLTALGAASPPPCGEGSGVGGVCAGGWSLACEGLLAAGAEFAPPPLTPPRKAEGRCIAAEDGDESPPRILELGSQRDAPGQRRLEALRRRQRPDREAVVEHVL